MDILTILFFVGSLLLSLAWLYSAANHRRVAKVAAGVSEWEVAHDRNMKAILAGATAINRLFFLFVFLLPYLSWIDPGAPGLRHVLFAVWVVNEAISGWAWRKTF